MYLGRILELLWQRSDLANDDRDGVSANPSGKQVVQILHRVIDRGLVVAANSDKFAGGVAGHGHAVDLLETFELPLIQEARDRQGLAGHIELRPDITELEPLERGDQNVLFERVPDPLDMLEVGDLGDQFAGEPRLLVCQRGIENLRSA